MGLPTQVTLKLQINRDPVAAQMQRMRSQIEQLQAELVYYRGDSSVSFEELQVTYLGERVGITF